MTINFKYCILLTFFIISSVIGLNNDDISFVKTNSTDTVGNAFTFTIKTMKIDNGDEIIINDFGYSLYTFSKDSNGISSCYGLCSIRWPPVIVSNLISIDSQSPLNTTSFTLSRRKKGLMQVNYNNSPLYYFIWDLPYKNPKGNGKNEFKGNFTTIKINN